MLVEYNATTDLLVSTFGKTRIVDDLAAGDFEALRADMAKKSGPVHLGDYSARPKGRRLLGVGYPQTVAPV
jgi:hypothetical protein